MGGPVELTTAPNGAVVNAEVLDATAKILHLAPTIEEAADGVWYIGGHSVGNTTLIEGEDGLILYDVGDNKEEGEHIRDASAKISDKPVKAIIYSHSHYALGGGALVDDPEDVLIIGHPKLNDTVESSLQGGGAPSAIPEVRPILSARALIQFKNVMPDEGPDTALSGKTELGKAVAHAGGVNRFFHLREPTPIDAQTVIRMNRDTLYSTAIVDISEGARLTLPDTGGAGT